jgi:hypothetical protein
MSKIDPRKTLTNSTIFQRGLILHNIIALEKAIDIYLSRYFCKEQTQRTEILEQLFASDKITLRAKIQLFQSILETHEKVFLEENPKILKEIVDYCEKRNIFAHYIIEFNEDAFEKQYEQITFRKFKNSQELVSFKYTDLSKINKRILSISLLIMNLYRDNF